MMPGPRVRKWFIRALAVALLPVAGFVAWNLATDNFGTVREGRVYRSGQMAPETLAQTLKRTKARTVLNLRGAHPDQVWYRAERKATLDAGATQVDVAMSSCEWMSRAQLRALVDVLDHCEYPLVVHCWRGSERTGLVSALTELLRSGGTLADARAQFSLRYLFVRLGDGKVTAEHLDQYESWLKRQGITHDPGQFRRWVAEGFTPQKPSREDWPYDPYPLVVISRPESPAARIATGPASKLSGPRADRPTRE